MRETLSCMFVVSSVCCERLTGFLFLSENSVARFVAVVISDDDLMRSSFFLL